MVSVTAKDENFRDEVQRGNIWKIVFRVCVPLAIYSWISQLFSVLDTLMASRISSEAVSTVVYMVQLQHIVLSVGQGLSVGGGIMIAHAYGRGDWEKIRRILSTTIALCLILSLLILAAIPFTPFLLRLSGTPEIFIELGSLYFSVTLVGIIIQFFTTIYISCERCRGRSRKILFLNLSVVIIKLAVTALFVYVLEGDIVSIAAATLISYVILFIYALKAFCAKNDAFSFSRKCITFRKEMLSQLFRLSVPSMIEKMAFAAGKAMVNNMASGYGTDIVGAAGISNNMSGLLTGIQTGFEDGGASLEGQLYGSRNFERTVKVYRHIQAAVLMIAVAGFFIMLALTDQIARLFSLSRGGYDPSFHSSICSIFHYELFGTLLLSFAYSGFTLLLGMGKTKAILAINVARIFVFRLPVIFFFQHFTSLDFTAVGLTMAISNSSVGIVALIAGEIIIRKERKRLSASRTRV